MAGRAIAFLIALSFGSIGVIDSGPASAQYPPTPVTKRPAVAPTPEESARDASILRRPHIDKPDGWAIGGGFVVYPKLEVDGEYDDNVFRTRSGRQDDFIFRVRPSFSVETDWGEHALGFFASAEIARYAKLTSQDYEAFAVGGSGKYDINDELAWTTDVTFERIPIPPGAPGLFSGGFSNPLQIIQALSATTQLIYGGDPFYGRVGSRFRRIYYVKGVTFDSDFNVYDVFARVGYKITPELSVFVDPSYQWVKYDKPSVAGPDNQGFDVRAGVAYDVARDLTVEGSVGYYRRTYDGPGKPASGVSFLGRLYWNPTDTVSIEAEARQGFTQYRVATVSTAGALANGVETYIGVRGGWEPIDPLLLDAGAAVSRYTYSGSGGRENYIFFDAGAKYYFNTHFYAGPRYYFSRREAKPSSANYTDNRFMITLGAQL
ncbi:MAG: outer membrane beta-barrel protein [Alphaproteobacteria bacterium]|nr:outer membrane beta-barrel protein [Alphaproteobacteria bacterium]